MNNETMIVLQCVRTLQTTWSIDERTPPREHDTKRVRESAYRRLVHHIGDSVSHAPNRHQMVDWLGRRLITWGWHLRMHYGSRHRV